jgi:serine/threonine-protein kinase
MALKDQLKSLLAGSRKLDVRQRFEILREAISGTMSSFYMARDRKTNQVVGLKVLDPEKTKRFEARFKGLKKPTEGQIAIQFDHPYIVKTLEHGITTGGGQYLVMEYLDGAGMNFVLASRDRLAEGRSILDGHRVKFIKQIAEALDTVHKAGFIHRDVCPRNLILSGDNEVLKLTDFGLTVPATPPFMRPGNRTGTPNYMAPELIHRRPTDQRLDVFAFGVTAYEICTFELPWPTGSRDEYMTGLAAMAHTQPPAPITKFRPQIHPELADAIHSCLVAEVPKRCPSMEHFLRTIRRIKHEDAG